MSEPRCDICERPYPHDIAEESDEPTHRWPPELFEAPVDAYLASHEADEELARALKHMAFGGGSDAMRDDYEYDVGFLTYSGEATSATLAAAILTALRKVRAGQASELPPQWRPPAKASGRG